MRINLFIALYMNFYILCVYSMCVTAALSELSVQINRELTGKQRDRQLVNILTQINSVSALCLCLVPTGSDVNKQH